MEKQKIIQNKFMNTKKRITILTLELTWENY